jgi:hypothetical protein
MSQEGLEFLIRHDSLTPFGVEQRNLVKRVLWWQQLVLTRPVPAPLQGDDCVVHGLWFVALGGLAVSDPRAVRNPITERSGILPCHISCRARTVLYREFGQPTLVIKIGVDRSLNPYRVKEHGEEFADGEGWKGTTAVVVDLNAEALERVPGNLEAVCLTAEAVTPAANIGDIPTATDIGLSLTRHGCSFPNKNFLAGEAPSPV